MYENQHTGAMNGGACPQGSHPRKSGKGTLGHCTIPMYVVLHSLDWALTEFAVEPNNINDVAIGRIHQITCLALCLRMAPTMNDETMIANTNGAGISKSRLGENRVAKTAKLIVARNEMNRIA